MTYSAHTRLLIVDAQHPESETIITAAEVIQRGGLVAFPTETVYGLGANGLNARAVANIFAAKERPANDPIILHIRHLQQLETIAQDIPAAAYDLAAQFFPGALTLVLKKRDVVPDIVTAGQPTVAVRMPDHPVAAALIEAAGVPIAAPSANRFSRPSPTTAAHVLQDLTGRVDVVLDGGAVQIGVESTIVDLSGDEPTVLRPGGVTLERLREVLPTIQFTPRYLPETVNAAPSPGTLLKHYSPDARLLLYQGDERAALAQMKSAAQRYLSENQRVGVLAMDGQGAAFAGLNVQIAHLGADIDAAAAALFGGMRQLDALGVDVILVHAPPASAGLGVAVWDRLLRAAEGQVIEVKFNDKG